MSDFTSNMTKAATVDDSLIKLWDEGVIIAAQPELIMDQFANVKVDIGAQTIQFTKYSTLTKATTALTDGEDVTSVALSDTAVTLTPVEQGLSVTTTNLANLQTGGKVDRAALQLIGINMGQTLDTLAINVLEASTNELVVGQSAATSLTASNLLTTAYMEKAYNKLKRSAIPKVNGAYVCIMHPDVASDLRNTASAGDWVDVTKYATPDQTLKNEVAMFKGFRVIENANITIGANVNGYVDQYKTLCFGFNALGKAVSQAPGIRVTGPFDKLGRFVNLGWYGVLKYGIIDQNALWMISSASSFGNNAS